MPNVKITIEPAADIELLMVEQVKRTIEMTPIGEKWVFEGDVIDVPEEDIIWFHLLAAGQTENEAEVKIWVDGGEKELIEPKKTYNGKGHQFWDEEVLM